MPFGVAPFMGLDSLVNRRLAQQRESGLYPDPLETLDPWTGTPPNTYPVSPDLGPGMPVLGETEGMAQAQPRRGFLGRAAQRLLSRQGLPGLSTGIVAGTKGRTPFEAFALGLAGGIQGNVAGQDYGREQEIADRNYDLAARRIANEEAITSNKYGGGTGLDPTSQMQNYEYLTKVLGVEPEKARYQVWGASGPTEQGSNLPELLRIPQDQWPLYLERIAARDKATAGAGGVNTPQFSAEMSALIQEYKQAHPEATDSDAVLAIKTGQFGAPPRITSIQTWGRDLLGPLYITPDGRLTHDAYDKKTNTKYQPWMVPQEREWGNPFGDNAQQQMPDPGGVR